MKLTYVVDIDLANGPGANPDRDLALLIAGAMDDLKRELHSPFEGEPTEWEITDWSVSQR